MAERPAGHESFRIEIDGSRAIAICSCGWRSPDSLNAGMAGARWDRHLEELEEQT